MNLKQSGFHSAKVTCLEWHPNSKFLLSGSLDTAISAWSIGNSLNLQATAKGAHSGCVTSIRFIADDAFVSGGMDSCIKEWRFIQ
jgi:WD40 repeat protein